MAAGVILRGISLSGIQYNLIRRGVLEGLSVNRIQDALSAGGIGLRRINLLAVVRDIKGVEDRASTVKFVGRDRVVNVDTLPEAVTSLRRTYSYEVRLRGVDIVTGREATRWVTVSTNSSGLTRREIEERASDFGEDYRRRDMFDVREVSLVSGRRAGAAGLL